jgi:metal-responsive CopG/Arc/MetJ family transcriptional regulator
MKRATMTFPDDLAQAVEEYVRAQEAPPALTAVVQAALREYLRERGFLRAACAATSVRTMTSTWRALRDDSGRVGGYRPLVRRG